MSSSSTVGQIHHYEAVFTTINNYSPLLSIINYINNYAPLLSIMNYINNYSPLLTIINYINISINNYSP